MSQSGIYCILNTATNKRYVGQSIDIEVRQKEHFKRLRQGDHYNEHLQNSYKQYGIENFEFRVLEIVVEELLDIREVAWINYYQTTNRDYGYNIEVGGGRANKRRSEETKQKISAKLIGRKLPKEQCENISKGRTGIQFSDEHKANISKAQTGELNHQFGKKATPEMLQKLSIAHLGKKHTPESIKKCVIAAKLRWQKRRENNTVSHKTLTLETRQKISKANLGKTRTLEARQKMSESKKRMWKEGTLKCSPETLQKISEASKRMWQERREKAALKNNL